MPEENLGGSLEDLMQYGTLRNAAGQVVTLKDGVIHLDGIPQPPSPEIIVDDYSDEEDEGEIMGIATGEDWYGEE